MPTKNTGTGGLGYETALALSGMGWRVIVAGRDLRTPMTRMRLRAEFLSENERAEWLSDLDEMDRIADSAIQLVREETSSDKIEIVNLDEVVGRVVLTERSMP